MQKYCPDCRQYLPSTAFARNRSLKDGFQCYCRACSSRRTRESRTRLFGPPKTRRGLRPLEIPAGHKWCADCDETKPFDQFSRNRTSRSGYTTYCKPCTSVRNRESHLRRTYGLTDTEFAAFMTAQGLCAIRQEAPAEHVDHDHVTGRVRGLLCFNCNDALGQFRDRRDLMLAAVAYLDANGFVPLAERPVFGFSLFHGDDTSPRPDDEPLWPDDEPRIA